uniref:Uncharacterized protein n=1 Tax=Anguilla anguilla TaxID=7936 RepID=A0A0E9QP12_ANGAN
MICQLVSFNCKPVFTQ